MKPSVLIIADVPDWAWERKAKAYERWLSDEFEISIAYQTQQLPDLSRFDLVHLFEVSQIGLVVERFPETRPFKLVAGLTANVWRTWGALRMQQWVRRVDALHGNSLLIYHDLKQFHDQVYYTPNGVDPQFFRRIHNQPSRVIFGHVGKPNPRKGGHLIIEAARKAKVECRIVMRTSKVAMSAEDMRSWYQGVSVMVCASNMDGTPNPMLEGAATECAVLSTPIGNMPEFIKDGYNGFLLKESLPYHGPEPEGGWSREIMIQDAEQTDRLREALIERMRYFADHVVETQLLGKQARLAILADWTWERQTKHVAEMWRAVLR